MFYRPDFCCGCGEKIERADWKLWTSTRFCDVCSTDHPLIEIVPKVLAVIGVLAGSLGIGSLIKGPPAPAPAITRQAFAGQTNASIPSGANFRTTETLANQSQRSSPIENANIVSKSAAPVGNLKAEPQASTEPIYFCGAETRKGTPCTRKVKVNVRCWQHRGMPAMLPPEKLLISK
jgi:hypothetical protein